MKAFILAAGEGQRLRPLTDRCPKPMVLVGNRPLLERIVDQLKAAGITEIWINLHHCPESVRKHFGDGSRFGVNISYSLEETLLGTAGAVKNRESDFLETFLVYYGDNYVEIDLADMVRFHREQKAFATIAVFPADETSASGVVEADRSGRIRRFLEKPPPGATASRLVNAGIYLLEPAVLRAIPGAQKSDFGRDIFPTLLAQKKLLCAYSLSGKVIGIDTPLLLSRLESYLLERKSG